MLKWPEGDADLALLLQWEVVQYPESEPPKVIAFAWLKSTSPIRIHSLEPFVDAVCSRRDKVGTEHERGADWLQHPINIDEQRHNSGTELMPPRGQLPRVVIARSKLK